MPDRPTRVIIVIDDPTIREILVRTLDSAGLESWAAMDTEQSLELAASPAASPDLVLLGHVVPRADSRTQQRRWRPTREAEAYSSVIP